MDIIIAGLIIAGLPGSAEWPIGLLAGLNLLFGGATLIGMALAARNHLIPAQFRRSPIRG